MPVPFFRHGLGRAELDAIAEVFKGPILTTGDTVVRFEEEFSRYLEVAHCLGTNSCTGALHMALLAFGVGPGDELITTPLTFIASSAAICEVGARPVFVDVEPDTGNLDVDLVEGAITGRTKAILPVHLYGLMCDMKRLRRVADKHGLRIIEDAAHCIEGSRDGVRPGQLGDAAAFSFYATKNLTCGEGGALVFRDSSLVETLRLLRLHGMTKMAADRVREGYSHWDMTILGWKYNMDNIQAAMLLPQLGRIDMMGARRREIASWYDDALEGMPITRPARRSDAKHAWHLYVVRVASAQRDRIVEELTRDGVGCMVNYRPIHRLTYFDRVLGHGDGSFPVAETWGASVISLPFYPALTRDAVSEVATALKAACALVGPE